MNIFAVFIFIILLIRAITKILIIWTIIAICILLLITAATKIKFVLQNTSSRPKEPNKQLYLTLDDNKVHLDTVYQEAYEEGRRHRDHELNISIWYTTLLTAIAGAIFTARYTATVGSSIYNALSCSFAQFLLTFISGFIAFSGIYSVLYSHQRYEQTRVFLDKLEPLVFENKPISLTPRHLIIVTQLILFVLIFLVIWVPFW
jgi:hypothetical protein